MCYYCFFVGLWTSALNWISFLVFCSVLDFEIKPMIRTLSNPLLGDAFSWYCFWITSKQHLSVHAREQELMLLTRVHPPNKFTTANITPFVCTMTFCEDYFFVLSGVTLPTDLVGVEFTINIHPNMNSRLYPQMTIVTHVGTVLQYMSRLELDFCRQNILFSHWVLFQLSRMWNV